MGPTFGVQHRRKRLCRSAAAAAVRGSSRAKAPRRLLRHSNLEGRFWFDPLIERIDPNLIRLPFSAESRRRRCASPGFRRPEAQRDSVASRTPHHFNHFFVQFCINYAGGVASESK